MNCRYCEYNLDNGDIFEKLSKDPLYKYHTKDDLLKVANLYGWTQENHAKFSKEVVVKNKSIKIKVCPKCDGIWPLEVNMPMEHYNFSKK